MRIRPLVAVTCALALCALAGCRQMPGHPGPAWRPPQDNMNFEALYSKNCAACHGENGREGAAISLNNPEYLALANDKTLMKWISAGKPDDLMPAFSKGNGGTLTDKQIAAMIQDMHKKWGKANPFGGATPPPYEQPTGGGNAQQGQQDYANYCASCHKGEHSSIIDPSYLALMSDQTLRSIIIAGRADLGQPDWRHDKAGHPLTDKEVTDIVTYLGSLRVATPGHPYPSHP